MQDLLEQLAGLSRDQHGQRCIIMDDAMSTAVGEALISGYVTLKGIKHKRVLVCISEEGLFAVRLAQRGRSQVLHGSTP